MLKRYLHTEYINAYRVDKELIRIIENYCQKQIPKYFNIDEPRADEISVTIQSVHRATTYRSINEFKNNIPDKDINAIIVNRSYYDDSRGIVVSIRFDRDGDYSYIQTCVYDDPKSSPVLLNVQSDIFNVISSHKIAKWYYYAPESIIVPILALILIICVFGILLGNIQLKIISILVVAAVIFYLVTFRNEKGSCRFNLKTG